MRALPNMTVIAPCDAEEMRRLMPLTVDHPGPLYIRLAKGYDPVVSRADLPCAIGRGILVRRGRDALVVCTGVMLQVSLDAVAMLSCGGLDVGILHLPTIKPLDVSLLLEEIASVDVVVSVEEHSVVGGLGSAVAETIAEAGFRKGKCFRRLGLPPDCFPEGYGSQAELWRRYGLTAESIRDTVMALVQKV